jgi:hypothetical protein
MRRLRRRITWGLFRCEVEIALIVVDLVYTFDWYDGPRSGVADYDGLPHYYESQWADIDHIDEDWYRLSPIPQEVFELELERERLWAKYAEASAIGIVGPEHHPFLPDDRPRGEELLQLLETALRIDEKQHLISRDEFIPINEQARQATGAQMMVNWTILPNPPCESRRAEHNS